MDETRVVFLEINTFIGSWALGASHYYGTLKKRIPRTEKDPFGLESHDLEHKLTKREAAEMNKDSLFDYNWKAGSTYHGFPSKEAVIKEGLKRWKEWYPDADILVLGDFAIADPQLILSGPQDLMDFVNPLAEEQERIGGYEGDEDRANELYKTFSEYWRNYG